MTAKELLCDRLTKAKAGRHEAEGLRQECTEYYEGRHRTALEIADSCKREGIPWITAMCPDPYIHVESQVTGEMPDFSFRGREPGDEENAKSREAMVRYILEKSDFSSLAIGADRRAIIGGTAVWKCFWDGEDVCVASVDPHCIFPDPAARSVEDCEYLLYCYPIQRTRLARLYKDELRHADVNVHTMASDPFGVFPDLPEDGDTAVVTEHWYRTETGGIGYDLYAGGECLVSVGNYWETTGFTRFPFVFQYRISDADSIWGRGDIAPILTLVDAADRELSAAQLSSAFSGSDVVLAEHDAFSVPPSNRPGAIWELKPGAMGKVARLGGRTDGENRIQMLDKLRGLMQETVGNFDVDLGKAPSGITSATGLAQLIERAELRRVTKKEERLGAFRRLLGLIDCTALEFYDARKTLYIGAGTVSPATVGYDPALLRGKDGYYPEVDTVISTSDGMRTSRAFLMSAVDGLLGHTIDEVNYPLAARAMELAGLGDAGEVEAHFRTLFGEEEKDHGNTHQSAGRGDPVRLSGTGSGGKADA